MSETISNTPDPIDESIEMRNIRSLKDHAEATRKIVRELEVMINNFDNSVSMLTQENALMKEQIKSLQVRLFSGGATS
jgi:predicted  nucleic acid-binding Zn-ribbon protein